VTLSRHFVTVGNRQVHYRRAGAGAPVVLLHASPSSSWALTTFIETFGREFAAIGLDTPGYGLSDPLAIETPEIGDYAEALAETLDGLGIGRCALFGSHTGATIALEFARRYPERVSVALFDGYPAWPEHERLNMEREYLPPWQPVWTGLHLVDFFLRYREMSLYWPWYDRRKATRAKAGLRNLDMLHRMTLAGFVAGRGYAKGYAAVFRYDQIGAVRDLKVPTCFAGRAEDSLNESLKLLGDLPDICWRETLPADDHAAALRYLEIIRERPGDGETPLPETQPLTGRIARRFVRWSGGDVLVREAGNGDGTPLIVLPQVPGSSEPYETLMQALSRGRRVIAIDPPGNGDSDLAAALPFAQLAQAVTEVLDGLGLAMVDLYGHQGGATLAAAVAALAPGRVRRMVLDAPPLLPEDLRDAMAPHYAAPIELDAEGGHLLKLWHALRNEQLFWPWYNETLAAVRAVEPDLEPSRLTVRAIGILKQHRNYAPSYAALFAADLGGWLDTIACPTLVAAAENDPFAAFAPAAAARIAGAETATLPIPAVDRAVPIRNFLEN
jgi:pimeloyl-ACP methyl ester carboxylesterase